ncbi:MAG: Gfo/Idh/MocA family oxidoreductase [Planctomycetota bacterium]|nr:MAG: Gfo/Idh/MocA family oxidoreductase [Planctomycetota bacterium]
MKDKKKTTEGGDGKISRRDFIAGAAATSFVLMKPSLVRGTEANSKIKLGIIGCGMRGKWITDLFQKHGKYEIFAAADYFQDRVDELGEQFGVDKSRRYATLSGYKKLLDSGVDAVAIESPPYFHPEQAAAAVDAGVDVMVAKPAAVDVPGCKLIGLSGKKATAKKLVFYVDFQTRANEFYREAVKRAQYGDIGRLVCGEASFKCGDVWKHGWNPVEPFLKENPTDPETRLKAWGMDKVLSGDILVEQTIHAIDVATWILDADPVSAYGSGGRKHYEYGDIWDYFSAIYHFPNNVLVNLIAKQCDGGHFGNIGCTMYGLDGAIDTRYGGKVSILGSNPYKGGETGNLYPEGTSANIATFYDHVTKGQFTNTTVAPSVRSNLASILARDAAYKGGLLTYDEMLKANEKLESDVIKGLKA